MKVLLEIYFLDPVDIVVKKSQNPLTLILFEPALTSNVLSIFFHFDAMLHWFWNNWFSNIFHKNELFWIKLTLLKIEKY